MIRIRPRPTSLLAVALVLVACGGTDDPAPDDAAGEADDASGATVRVLTHDSFDVSEEVLDDFTARSGIEVELVPSGDAGTLVNQAVLTADAPQGDVLFGVDTTFLSRALDEDLFVPYTSPELDRVPDALQPPDERVTPVDVGDVCLNYDREAFDTDGAPPPPGSLADLADPDYAGMTVVMNPATSSPGMAFLLGTIEEHGQDGWVDYWRALRDNDVLVTDGWSEAYYDRFSGSGQGGDRPIVVSYASSPAAEVVFADPPTDTPRTGVVDASCVRQVEYAGILRGTEQEAAAREVVDFLLGVPFQEDVPLTMFVYPVVEDAELPEVFEAHAAPIEEPYQVDPLTIGDERDRWLATWTDTVLR